MKIDDHISLGLTCKTAAALNSASSSSVLTDCLCCPLLPHKEHCPQRPEGENALETSEGEGEGLFRLNSR